MGTSSLVIVLALGQAVSLLPEMPEPSPAPYVPPLQVLGDLPAGRVVPGEAGVLYDDEAHARLLLSLRLAEPLSAERAEASWRRGWLAAADAILPRCQEQRAARVEAEAAAGGATLGASLGRAWWVVLVVGVVAVSGGVWLGAEVAR